MPDMPTLRPINHALETSKILQRVLNAPLAMDASRAIMVMSALNAKYGFNSLTFEGDTLDGPMMEALSAEGRNQAMVKDASRGRGRIFDESEDVAIIPVYGSLTKSWGLDPWSGITGYDGIEAKYLAAMGDQNIKAIWLDIDSGGGDVAGLFDLVDMMWGLNYANSGIKPVYAWLGDYAYSAAYAIASVADKIFIPRTGGAGSVGVISMHATFARAYEKQGIDVTVIRAGTEKARANSVELLPEHTRKQLEDDCEKVRDIFIKTVARNRRSAMTEKKVRETEALTYMGEDARAIGFVSEVCSEAEAWGKLQRRINR